MTEDSAVFGVPYTMLADIGDTHGKFAARDAGVPLFRFGFPIFDRVNKHRYPIIGYQGVVNMVTEICNKFSSASIMGSFVRSARNKPGDACRPGRS